MKNLAHIWHTLCRIVEYRDEPSSARLFAHIGWQAILVVSMLLLLAACSVGAVLLVRVEGVDVALTPPAQVQAVDPFSREELSEAIEVLEKRKAAYDALVSAPPQTADPSVHIPAKEER